MLRNLKWIFAAFVVTMLTASCSSDEEEYEYAQLTAEMCDAYSAEAKQLAYAVTDSDVKLMFSKPLAASWVSKGDSVYRSLIYYNKVSGSDAVMPVKAEKVFMLKPRSLKDAKDWADNADPVGYTSGWMARNGKFLNMQLTLKSGSTSDDTQKHSLGVVCDTVVTSAGGMRYYYRLAHGQNGVPAYYSVDLYVSIPTGEMHRGDTLTITIPTWTSTVRKDFIIGE